MSAKPSFTPGPWSSDTPPTGYVRIIGNIDCDARDDGTPRHTYTHVCDVIDGPDEMDNARLIAAAPDLYAQVELLEKAIEYEIEKSRKEGDEEGARLKTVTLNMCRAALAKARGEL